MLILSVISNSLLNIREKQKVALYPVFYQQNHLIPWSMMKFFTLATVCVAESSYGPAIT